MDYIYNGEVQLYQEKLDNFLSIAQRLKLEGLIGNNDEDSQQPDNFKSEQISGNKDEDIAEATHYDTLIPKKPYHNSKPRQSSQVEAVDKVIVPISSEDVSEVENAVNQHLEKDEAGMWKCKLCGKTANTRQHLRNHIETHLEGLSFPCDICGKTFRSRNALFIHNTRYHK